MADDENNKLLQELDVLSQTLYQGHNARRTASLALPRSSVAIPTVSAGHSLASNPPASDDRPRHRRLSMSPYRSRPQLDSGASASPAAKLHLPSVLAEPAGASGTEKKGIWNWKPVRALSHIGMHRIAVLFSVEVSAIQSLPASMNGLRLSVCVRKKDSKEGAVQTMPARVQQGAADFEETLFIRTHLFYSGGGSAGKPLRFEPRPFLIFPVAIDARELDFGRSSVDLSSLVKESTERSFEGSRVRQWDAAFKLLGKAKGGEMVIKFGFQIMEDGGVGIYRQASEVAAGSFDSGVGHSSSSSSSARRQSKFSFSISSPRSLRFAPAAIPNDGNSAPELKGIEEFNLDEDPEPAPAPVPVPLPPAPPPPNSETEIEPKVDDLELPDFEVVDKGIEAGLGEEEKDHTISAPAPAPASASASASTEVVKEVVPDSVHSVRLTELDCIAKQIKALELMMMDDGGGEESKSNLYNLQPEGQTQELNAEEEMATREFLQMLEVEGDKEAGRYSFQEPNNPWKPEAGNQGHEGEAPCYLPDLGKGLGPIVQTRDGGYLASMNPFDMAVPAGEAPRLAMQISRPIVIDDPKLSGGGGGFEVFQKLAGEGLEELESKLMSLTCMDELTGKAAEQIAFEGIASAIVSGRSKELAKSAAAKSIAALKSIATEMKEGRKERIGTGIWNVREEPLASVEEALSFSLQKMEAMAIDALKLQGGVMEEEPPFSVSPLVEGGGGRRWLFDCAAPLEDWLKRGDDEAEMVVLMVLVQLRDPLRGYEVVGAPMIAVVQAARVDGKEEGCYKVSNLHIGGMKLSSGRRTRSVWDGERQRLTALQWLGAHGMAKGGKKTKVGEEKGGKDVVWSLSARVMADMWLKPTRNPDVKLTHL